MEAHQPQQLAPRRPDFLCVGAAKAGTTWLHRVLRGCPGYWMPCVKELRYLLLRELRVSQERNARNRVKHILRNIAEQTAMVSSSAISESEKAWLQHYVLGQPKDRDWYFGLFAQAGDRLTGDITPGYAALSDVEAVRQFLPSVSVIFIVRNPLERDLSHAAHHAVLRTLGMPKGRALALHLAHTLGLQGDPDEQIEVLRVRHGIIGFDASDWLAAYGSETGKAIHPNELLDILGAKVTVEDVRAMIDSPGIVRQQRQSEAIRTWSTVFGSRFKLFLFDDMLSSPRRFVRDVTAALGRLSEPEDQTLLNTNFNPGVYAIPGLDDVRAELGVRGAAEIDALHGLLGDRVPNWRL